MDILLTNDDGISAEGINVLFDVLSEKHYVFMMAPATEKSGSSSAITIKENLRITRAAENKYAVHGYTADCVNVGLRSNIIPKVDLVVSGINHGPNKGEDIYFSGTVGGARIAHISGISGIAISVNSITRESNYFYNASRFLLDYIDDQDMFPCDGGRCHFLNINYPDLPEDRILGIKYSALNTNKNNDFFKIISRNDGEISLRYTRESEPEGINGTDITDVKNGHISITPLLPECTDNEFLLYLSNSKKTGRKG